MKFLLSLFVLLQFGAHAQTARYAEPCTGDIPALNQGILDVLKPYIGKKIGRGECWDAAQLALNAVGAKWDGLYVFGRVVNVRTECIQPGDIVQFEKAEFEVKTENGSMSEQLDHHTAIVYKVNGPGDLELLHQNTGQYGRKMGVTQLNLANKKRGTVTVYRPQ
jgi:hypothetical protein